MKHPPNASAVNAHTHEKTDASVRTVLISLAGLSLGGLVVWLIVAAMWHYFTPTATSTTPFPIGVPRELPPNPRLQVTPYLDWDRYRQDQVQRLRTYGWVDQSAGRVHIPIDRAMDIVLQKGLPTRAAGESSPAPTPRKEPNEPAAH